MKKIYSIYFLLGLFITAFYSCGEDLTPVGPDIAEITHFRNDGPYLFYENGKLKILEVTKENTLNIREESGLPAGLKLDVYSDDNQLLFQVPINKIENFERPAWEDRTEYAKTFAVSDLHGRFDLFAAILKTGEVINDKYEWIYGSNHLVIDGDIFDRGADVLPILWLIYKLEFEAKAVGGRVTTILGDHEEMIMRDNLKYTYAKYNTLSQRAMNMTYGKMWGLTNVMGNWLRSKNTIQIVGENLYVHAGLSKVFMEREETIPEINELVSKSIYLSKEERKKQYPDIADFLYSDSYNGPLWYRGMVKTGSEYSPIKEADVDKLLAQYDVKRIIIGHTENSRVKYTVHCNADVAEEVARFYGYDKIPMTLPTGEATTGKLPFKLRIQEVARDIAEYCGFSEGMSYSFESPKVFDKLCIPEDSELRKVITISNPLGEDYSIMRTSTLNGMLASLSTNYNRRNKDVRLYELGNIYLPKSLPVTELPDERTMFTLGMYGKGDFFDMKGVCEEFFEKIGMKKKVTYDPNSGKPFLHPGRQANMIYEGKVVGYLGEVHPAVADNYSIGEKAYIAVIDILDVLEFAGFNHKYTGIAKYPAVTRDLSLVVPHAVLAGQIEEIFDQRGGNILESYQLFDIYEGAQIEKGFKSMAYSLVFRAHDKTLGENEISAAMKKIMNGLNGLGIELRS